MGKDEDGYFKNYPKHVFLILANEFCERFSYYGMKAFLVLYLTDALLFDDNTATAIYHSFVVLCYFMPLFGAMIADGWLGKFKTILYITLVYIAGSIIMTITAIPFNGYYVVWAPFIGLALIAFGTGGIKPNVSAFGGDQFTPDQTRQKTSFFSLFYMSINVGSLLSMVITPLIRGYVYCFDDNCYSLAFGIPAILMIVSEIVFAAGYKWYVKVPPGESIIRRMFGCVGTAIGRKCHCCCAKPADSRDDRSSESGEKKSKRHWLDYAAPDYDDQFISDMKDVLRVSWLFLPLPMFWALFDQQGSRWTLQATQLNGDVGGFIVLPDLIQVINPLIIVVFVPIFESIIYPCLDKIHIPHRPLQRMAAGMIMASVAFLLAGFLQISIDKDIPPAIPSGQAKYQFINPSSCAVDFRNIEANEIIRLESLSIRDYQNIAAGDVTFEVKWNDGCLGGSANNNFTVTLEAGTAYQFFTDEYDKGLHQFTQDRLALTSGSQSALRFYNALHTSVSINISTVGNQESTPREFGVVAQQGISKLEEIILADYEVTYSESTPNGTTPDQLPISKHIYSQNGALYVVILHNNTGNNEITIAQLTELNPWSNSIFLQVPQYFVITIGEVLFSITGLSFAYTQASPSMKSILTSIWLMTVAIGNLVVVIVAETGSYMSQMAEFFLFSGLMFVTTIIFMIMAYFYKYVERNDWGGDQLEEKLGEDNFALEISEEKLGVPEYEDINKGIDTPHVYTSISENKEEKALDGRDDHSDQEDFFDEKL